MDIQSLRQQYPQYDDMSDFQIANAIHQKFYSDMPVDKVYTALGVKPGYQDSSTGKNIPIANAGQQAADPGSALAGTAAGVGNVGIGIANSIPKGLGELAGAVKGAVTPGETADNTSREWGDSTWQIPGINPDGDAAQAANSAVTGAVGKVANSVPEGLDWLYTKGRQAEAPLLAAQVRSGYATPQDQAKDEALSRAGLNIGGNVLGMAAGSRLFGDDPAAASAPAPTPQPIQTALSQALGAGYKLPPSEAAAAGASAPFGSFAEGLTGSAKLRTDAALAAQKRTNALAAQELGIDPSTPLTDAVLDQARAPHNAVYKEVSALSAANGKIPVDGQYLGTLGKLQSDNSGSFGGNPDIDALVQKYNRPEFDSADAVSAIKSLRKNASSNYKASNAFQVKNAYELGDLADAQKTVADALENQIQRFAQNIPGKEDLVGRWQQARAQLAKINSVDSAIKEGSTDVSAPALAKALNRGAPLSGNLRTIAEVTNNFPRVMTDAPRLANKGRFNMWETGMGTLGGAVSLFTHSPEVLAATGVAMMARPAIRAALLSDTYQGGLGRGTSFLNLEGAAPLLKRAGAPLLLGAAAQNPLYQNALLTGTR